ncbi:MAG TPA: DNA polymerase III subunit delta' [Burkholderiales bacterium]|nr:DNA polymerase III subunit delta' [Burkholderiales bacterium]
MVMPWHETLLGKLLRDRERLAHAFLVHGPEGIGKLAFAEAAAQSLLCERPAAAGAACGACPGCTWFTQGSHPDFRRLAPAQPDESDEGGEGREKKASDQIDVKQVRALESFINLSSHRGGARVIVVHPAEALNPSAANALLKSLEEPPPQTYFLLVAHRWHYLLPTIRSRCRLVGLALPEPDAALAWLTGEGVAAPELALAHAGGAPLAAAALDDEYWAVRKRLLDLLARAFDPLAAADELRDVEPARMAALLQKWSYDLVLQQASGRVRYNPDCAEALAGIAARLDRLETARFHRRIVQLQRVVPHPLNARLFLESMLVDCAELLRGTDARRAA